MVELGSHAATESAAMVTLRLTVSRARILSRHLHATFRGSRRRVTVSGHPVLGGVIFRGDPTTNLRGTLIMRNFCAPCMFAKWYQNQSWWCSSPGAP